MTARREALEKLLRNHRYWYVDGGELGRYPNGSPTDTADAIEALFAGDPGAADPPHDPGFDTGHPTYDIRTVEDFAKVPPKRLRACLKEFAVAMEYHRKVTGCLHSIEESLTEEPPEIKWMMTNFRWVDDGAPGPTTIVLKAGEESKSFDVEATP